MGKMLLLLVLFGITKISAIAQKDTLSTIQKSMIWTPAEIHENGGYSVFRKSFNLEKQVPMHNYNCLPIHDICCG